jgi:glycosyltransferase involved in cell wall biosynthesis
MRFLVDAHVFDEPHQGTRTYLRELYRVVIEMRPDDTFYFACKSKITLESEIGVHNNVRFIGLSNRGKYFRLLFEFPWLILRNSIDFAHFQYVAPPIKLCKYIITIHDVLFNDFPSLFPVKYRIVKNYLFKTSARFADVLFTVSEYSRKRIAHHYHIPIDQIHITSNGIREIQVDDSGDGFEMTGYDDYILYVSRVEPRKNHLILLQAFYELNLWKTGKSLVFIGKDDLPYKGLDEYLANLAPECRARVIKISNVALDDLLKFYKHAKVFVYPSLAEGFGIPPLEAVVAGIPTLCSNTTAMSDFAFLEDDLFDPTNLQELKLKISEKLSGKMDLQRLELLKNFVTKNYSWQKTASQYIHHLKENQYI